MKFRYFFLFIAFATTIQAKQELSIDIGTEEFDAVHLGQDPRFFVEEGLCYCSDLCGPRKVKTDDAPFYDEEFGLCFCKERDKNNYIPNGCHQKEKPKFNSVCD